MWHHRWGAVVTLGVLAVAGGVACGDDDGSDADAGPSGSAVTIEDFKFLPAELTVAVGEPITFTNEDGQAHTATVGAGNAFDSGSIGAGESASIEVAEAGRYPYHCSFHPFMTGTITVE